MPSSDNSEPGDKVLHGGILTNTRRPATKKPVTQSTTPRTREPAVLEKKPKPNLSETGCKSNCSMQGNQMCRTHGTSTVSKCVCKPGYARIKAHAPCRRKFLSIFVIHSLF